MPRKKENEIKVVNIRLVREPSFYGDEPVSSPDDALRVVADELKGYDREVFAVLNLKTNGKPINLNICSVGTLDASLVSPREVFKSCILSNAAAFIAIHNHPSGSNAPSKEDILDIYELPYDPDRPVVMYGRKAFPASWRSERVLG